MRRLISVLAALVLTIVPLAACATDEGTALRSTSAGGTGRMVSADVLRTASEATEQQDLAFDGRGEISAAGETIEIEMAGEVSGSSGDGEFSMRMSGAGMKLSGTVRMAGGDAYMRIDEISVDGASGEDTGILTGVWYVVEEAAAAPGGATAYDPDELLGMLEGITDDIEELGTEEIDGKPAAGYRVELSMEDLAAAVAAFGTLDPSMSQDDVDAAMVELAGSSMTFDVWVRDETVVRMVIDMELVSEMQLDSMSMHFDMRMRELDEPVIVEAPADARLLPGGF